MEEKMNIAQLVLQQCIEFNYVNPIKVEAYFNAMVCMKYTNIDFLGYTEDIYNLYDRDIKFEYVSETNINEMNYKDLG